MERNNKHILCIGLFLFVTVTCLLLCHVSFREQAEQPQMASQGVAYEAAAGYTVGADDDISSKGVLDVAREAITEASLVKLALPSMLNISTVISNKLQNGPFKKLINNIFAVLFKTVCIPTFIFAIMGSLLHAQTSLWRFILQYIQDKDGKKQVA